MEYLMTYGWAILIVIIVAAALYALGIFNPATYTGRIPTGFTTLGTPEDWDLDTGGDFRAIFNNRLAEQITVFDITVTMTGGTPVTWNTMNCTGDNDYMKISPGATLDPSTECPDADTPYAINLGQQTAGTTYSLSVSMLYNAGGLNHTERGTLTGTVSS